MHKNMDFLKHLRFKYLISTCILFPSLLSPFPRKSIISNRFCPKKIFRTNLSFQITFIDLKKIKIEILFFPFWFLQVRDQRCSLHGLFLCTKQNKMVVPVQMYDVICVTQVKS